MQQVQNQMNGDNGQQNDINHVPVQNIKVNPQAFGAKFSSKREVYRFLTCDAGVYLSSYDTMSIFHMRDIAAGKRFRILQTEVKQITVPFFKGLKIELMLEFARNYPQVINTLPMVEREIDRLPRDYVANIIFTIVGEPFQNWVNMKVNERHEKVAQQQDQIEMDPSIHAIYQASNSTSVLKGISNNLMKAGAKRRRTKQEIIQDKQVEAMKLMNIEERMQQMRDMQQELERNRVSKDMISQVENIVSNLKASGMVKVSGENQFQAVSSWEESQQLLQQMADENENAQRLAEENQRLQQNAMNQERRRAGNQLEAIQEWNNGRNSVLNNSVVLVDHIDEGSLQNQSIGAGSLVNSQMERQDDEIDEGNQ